MRFLSVLVLSLLLAGCGANFSGGFSGIDTRSGMTTQNQLTITESVNGSTLTGQFSEQVSSNGSVPLQGTISGTVNGNLANYNFNLTSCSGGVLTGQGTLTGNTLTGSVQGTACGQQMGASFQLIRFQ